VLSGIDSNYLYCNIYRDLKNTSNLRCIFVEETHFTHMRRMLKIKPSIEEIVFENEDNDCEPITMIVDASGLTVSRKGDYIKEK
jgi:hypothetical protein